MPLVDLDENQDMFNEISSRCKPKDGTEFIIRNDDEWKELVNIWKEMKMFSDHYQRREKEAREKIIKSAKSRNTNGYGVKLQKIIRKGAIQYSEIEELKSIDLDQYRDMPTESWRIYIQE